MRTLVFVLASGAGPLMASIGCVPSGPPRGMIASRTEPHGRDPELVELARVDGDDDARALLVVYPRTACSGSASMVFVDDRGHFVGAVPPGAASLLRVHRSARRLALFSSVEVTSPVGTWFLTASVDVPPFPKGLRLESQRFGALQCGSGHYANAVSATKEELEGTLGDETFTWFAPEPRDGQAWLDSHRARVAEIRGGPALVDMPWVVPLQARR